MLPNAAYDKRPFDFGTRNPAADTASEGAAEPFAAKFRRAFRTRAARSYHTLPFRAVRPSFGAAYGMRFGRQEHGSAAGRHRPDSARGSARSGSPTGCHAPQCFIPRPFTRSVRPVSSHLADLYALAHAPPATVRKSDATYGRINDVSLKRNVSLGRLSMQSAVGHRIILHSDRIISISYTIYFTTHPAVSRHRTDAMSHRCILRFILYICISVPTGTYCLRFFLIVGFDDTEKPSQFPTVLFRPGIFLMRTHRIRRSRSPSLRREQRPN